MEVPHNESLNISDRNGNEGTLMAYIKIADASEVTYNRIISKKSIWNAPTGYELEVNPSQNIITFLAGDDNFARGELVPTDSLVQSAGRIAAQTAKQVVLQRLREAELELVLKEYADKEGQMFSVTIHRIEPRQIVVELGRTEGIIPLTEQSQTERFRVGQRIKVILQSVRTSLKGPEVILSRIDKLLVQRLFETEVPEVQAGSVEILSISREAGSRSKVAVWARQEGIDAVGSCVGLRGIRIQNIVNELQGEKIDVIGWDSDPARYISNALSPSDVARVEMYQDDMSATAIVPQKQLSLAIGKDGQNARLAARLTGWKIDIKSHEEAMEEAGGELPELIRDVSQVVEESPASSVDSIKQEPSEQVDKEAVHEKPRSEERRVGKECRSRWSPYH